MQEDDALSLVCPSSLPGMEAAAAGRRDAVSCPSSPTETESSSGFSTLRRRSINVTEKVRQNRDGTRIQVVRESAVSTTSTTQSVGHIPTELFCLYQWCQREWRSGFRSLLAAAPVHSRGQLLHIPDVPLL